MCIFEPAPLSISAKQIAPMETPFSEEASVQVHLGSVLTLFFQLLYAAKQEKGLELPFGGSFAMLAEGWCLGHFTALISARDGPEPGGRGCRDGACLSLLPPVWHIRVWRWVRTGAESWGLASFPLVCFPYRGQYFGYLAGTLSTSPEIPTETFLQTKVLSFCHIFFCEVIKYCYEVAQKMTAFISALSPAVPCC